MCQCKDCKHWSHIKLSLNGMCDRLLFMTNQFGGCEKSDPIRVKIVEIKEDEG